MKQAELLCCFGVDGGWFGCGYGVVGVASSGLCSGAEHFRRLRDVGRIIWRFRPLQVLVVAEAMRNGWAAAPATGSWAVASSCTQWEGEL